MLERFFRIFAAGSTPRTEVIAGLTTFLAMSYIVFVNPQILSDAGMDPGAVFVATCVSAAAGSIIGVLALAAPFLLKFLFIDRGVITGVTAFRSSRRSLRSPTRGTADRRPGRGRSRR